MAPLIRAELWAVSLPLRTAAQWTAGGAETAVPYLVLLLQDAGGGTAAAEITCRPAWNGMTPRLLAQAFQELAWPRIAGAAPPAALSALADLRGMTALRALCDNACRDFAPPDPGAPLPVCAVLTRDIPERMAANAAAQRAELGITAFKVKLGQGLEQDAAVLRALRDALGPDAALSGDANSAYELADLPDLFAMGMDFGLTFLEDPCPLAPDAATLAACTGPVPILVDKRIEDASLLPAFADRGLVQVSAKPSRVGATTARAIADTARKQRGRICSGTYSESALGAHAQIAFGQSLPAGLAHPHEVGFHRALAAQIAAPPQIRDGHVAPVTDRAMDRLDHDALRRFGSRLAVLEHSGGVDAASRSKDKIHG